jgi:hypothetical protein
MESAEGKEKSTALLSLPGGTEYFSDQTIIGRSDKEQKELLRSGTASSGSMNGCLHISAPRMPS